jgi:fucose permease
MNPTLILGTIIVTGALIAYSIGVIGEQRKQMITRPILAWLTVGIILDITATVCMILGSRNIPLTFHGILGYTALMGMLIDTVLIWKSWRKRGEATLSRGLHLYTRIAYIWWVLAYLAGGFIAMFAVRSV